MLLLMLLTANNIDGDDGCKIVGEWASTRAAEGEEWSEEEEGEEEERSRT